MDEKKKPAFTFWEAYGEIILWAIAAAVIIALVAMFVPNR